MTIKREPKLNEAINNKTLYKKPSCTLQPQTSIRLQLDSVSAIGVQREAMDEIQFQNNSTTGKCCWKDAKLHYIQLQLKTFMWLKTSFRQWKQGEVITAVIWTAINMLLLNGLNPYWESLPMILLALISGSRVSMLHPFTLDVLYPHCTPMHHR